MGAALVPITQAELELLAPVKKVKLVVHIINFGRSTEHSCNMNIYVVDKKAQLENRQSNKVQVHIANEPSPVPQTATTIEPLVF